MADKKGTGLLMVWADIPADKEEDFNNWYNTDTLAELLPVPGALMSGSLNIALELGVPMSNHWICGARSPHWRSFA